jgi:multiple sugar transport system substrate-binding protein
LVKLLLSTSLATGIVLAATVARAETDWKSVLGKHDGQAVNIMSIQDPFINAVRKISPKFEELTGAKVTTDGFGYDPLHEKEILGCSQQDGQYDVLFIDGIWVGEFVEAGCLDPVEDVWSDTDPKIIAWDDYVESFAGQAVWDGKKQCLPVGAYWQMVHYRKDLFDKAGLKAPTTLKETMDAAKVFTNNPDYPGISGYAMNFRRGAAAGQQYFEWIYSNGGKPWVSNYPGSQEPYSDQTPLLNSPESVSIVQFFKDMVKVGPPGVEAFAWDERFNAFAQGTVAMINAWSVQTPGLNDPSVSKVVGKWDVAMMPHADDAKSVPPVGGWIMCLNKHGARKEAAWDFMRWFASPEIHKEWVLQGAPPSRHSTFQDAEVRAAQPWVPTLYESAKAAWVEGRPRHALTFQMIDAIGLHVNRAIIGEATPQAAMDTAAEEVTNMLKSEGYIQ